MVIEGICNNKKKKFVFKKGQQLFLINSTMKEFLNVWTHSASLAAAAAKNEKVNGKLVT
jgi:phosphopantetheine adenylyltransferase